MLEWECGVLCVCAILFLRDLLFCDDHATESETIQSEHIRIPEREIVVNKT